MIRNPLDLLKLALVAAVWMGFAVHASAQDVEGGTLTLSGAYSGDGGVTLIGGPLTVNESGSLGEVLSPDLGGPLGGESAVVGTLAVSEFITLKGGTAGTSPLNLIFLPGGTLDVAAPNTAFTNLVLDMGSSFDFNFNTSALTAATISISGNLTLSDPNLTVTDAAATPEALPAGTSFTVINYAGTETGEFEVNDTAIPEGGTFTVGDNEFEINYASGDPNVTLTVVPEPSAWMLVLAGVGLLIFWQRITLTRQTLKSGMKS